MFRFEEDAFLRKGGEFSRNCLAFDEEEELAAKLSESSKSRSENMTETSLDKAKTVFVSAGGKCTEPLVRSLVESRAKWTKTSIGEFALENDEIVAFLCPSDRRPAKEPLAHAVNLERQVAKFLVDKCSKNSTTIVILCTSPAREQPDDFNLRKLPNAFVKDNLKIVYLEQGRLVTSFPAAILEQAALHSVPAICYIAPREAVLACETLDTFAELASRSSFFDGARKQRVLAQRKAWTSTAIRSDEKDSRRFEPEGMFM